MSIIFYNSRKIRGEAPAQEAVYRDFVKTYKQASPGKKKDLLFLVPRQTTLEVENTLIERTGGAGLFGSRVLSYDMIEREVLRGHGYDPTKILNAHGQVMMIQKASEDMEDELTLYRSSTMRTGFSKEAAKEIVLFRENGLDPGAIASVSEETGDRMLGRKLKDLSMIYQRYLEIMGDETIDLQKRIRLATELIRTEGVFEGKDLFILGFTSLSVLEREMLLSMMEQAENVRMAFVTDRNPASDDASAFEDVNRLEDALIRALADKGKKVEVCDLSLEKAEGGPPEHAEETLLSYKPPRRVDAGGKVGAHVLSEPWEEARYVAEVVRARIREGTPPERIAVILPDMETYGPVFSKVFAQEGLDFFLDRREPIIQSAFIESVLSALDAVRTGLNRDEILTFAKSYFSGLSPDEADSLENFVIQAGIQRGDWKRPFTEEKIARRVGKEGEEALLEAERMREKLMSVLSPLKAKTELFSEKIASLRNFLEKIGAREALDRLTERLGKEGKLNEVIRYRQIWDMLVEVINQLEAALGEQEGDLSEFSAVLKNGLSTYSVGVIPETSSLVLITDAHRGILPEVSFLAFCGLNEGVFPALPGSGGLLSDYEIRFLSENLGFKALEREKDDEYRFYNLFTGATDELLFTGTRFSSSGESQRPSVYMNRIRESFSLPEPEKISSLQKLEKEDVQGVLLQYLQNRKKGHPPDPVFEAALSYIRTQGISGTIEKDFQAIEEGLSFDGVDTALDAKTARTLYRSKPFYVSASSLEDYASCPYRYTVGRGIRLKEREEYEPRALDAGNLMHAFFENFFKTLETEEHPEEILERLSDPQNPYLEEKSKEILESGDLEDFKPRYRTTHTASYIYEKLEKMLRASARIQAEQLRRSGYRPSLFETRIEQTLREKEGGEGEIRLTGKIDRVDVKDESLAVVDYKSGAKKAVAYEAVNQGLMLQLLLYLENALTLIEGVDDPAGALYAFLQLGELEEDAETSKIKDEKLQGFVSETLASEDSDLVSVGRGKENMLTREEFELILRFVREKAREIAEEILSGNAKVRPAVTEKVSPCQYCPYRNICAVDLTPEKVLKVEKLSKEDFFESVKEKEESGEEHGH